MGVWKQIAALPNPRQVAASCWHDDKVYVFGGRADNSPSVITYTNTTYIYDPTGNTWSSGAALPATGLCYAFSTAADGIHVVFPATGAQYAYDPTANTWATRTSAPAVSRVDAHHFLDSTGRFYLAGGQGTSGGTLATVHRYDATTDSWTARADMSAGAAVRRPIASPGFLGSDNKAYLGYAGFTRNFIVYDPTGDTWSVTVDMPDTTAVTVAPARLPSGIVLALPHKRFAGSEVEVMHRVDGYDPATGLWSMGVTPDSPGYSFGTAVAVEPGGIVYQLGGLTLNPAGADVVTSASFAYAQNEAPTAATLLTLTGGVLVSTAVKNRARHQFNDPNAGDSQSKFDWRYRIVGATTWTTGTAEWPNPWHDIAAGDLDPGDYERQVLTYDAAGLASPWTASGFFTAADPPVGPTITYPINGQTVEQVERVDWSAAAQESYQVRRVADLAGAPDDTTIYFDTGEVVDTLARTLPLDFTVNSRDEHVQVRVKVGGLWSDWDDVGVEVTYTPPPVPTFTLYKDPPSGSMLLMITNPAPTGGEPAAAYNEVWIDDGAGLERKATAVATNSGWRYWTPISLRDYLDAIRVVAVAANGTTTSSS